MKIYTHVFEKITLNEQLTLGHVVEIPSKKQNFNFYDKKLL